MAAPGEMMELRLLCEQMADVQQKKIDLEAQLAEVNKEFDKLRITQIPEKMAELGVQNATFVGLGRVQLASDLYASTIEGQKVAAMTWLRDLGYEGMITETYNASSIKALFRRMMKDGIPIPDDIFKIQPYMRASIVKA